MNKSRKMIFGGAAVVLSAAILTAGCSTKPAEKPEQTGTIRPIETAQISQNSIAKSLEMQAKQLKTVDPKQPLDDLKPLKDMIGNANYVGLGEATHGSSEIFTMKHRLVKYLVTELGFTNFGIEEDWGNGLKLNEYIQTGKGNPRDFLKLLYPTDEIVAMVEWMREYNADPINKKKIQFIGLDLKMLDQSVFDKVINYVKEHHPDLLPEVEQSYKELSSVAGNLQEYMKLTAEVKEKHKTNAQKVVKLLEDKTKSNNETGSLELAWVIGTAKVIENFTKMVIPADYPTMVKLHDQYLAEHAVWAQGQFGGKTMVWGHNIHIAKGVITEKWYPKVAGEFLKERLGDQYVAIGTTTTEGKFTAFSEGKIAADTIQKNENSSNYMFGQVPYAQFLLDLHKLNGAAQQWVKEKQPFLDGIAQIVPNEPQYYDVSLQEQFDIMVHIQKTTPSHIK
ncbi:erythromycin esterase family protein [Paenibacillus sp. HWE-109]|uniref:erythromycin esterase family protein n=1 Tax=Paenibacillus sp. HWE-109 TaxID=1306526 RepID=UPI001EDEB541|nr:erythromycin esterase family protein [Paenibacillus sp. HWE-109]UKS29704.1 erythromycin esterase family protein [Paenibacillus sp. HWE-109]